MFLVFPFCLVCKFLIFLLFLLISNILPRHKPETQQPASASSAEAVNPTEQSAETEFEPAPPPQEQGNIAHKKYLLFFSLK